MEFGRTSRDNVSGLPGRTSRDNVSGLPDAALLETLQRAKMRVKDQLPVILSELSTNERCSLVFLMLERQELVTSGYKLCQYVAEGQDISESLWRGCGGSPDAVLVGLFHVCRYDLLEQRLGLCYTHSMEQVCGSLGGVDPERLAVYRVFATLPQTTADHLVGSIPWRVPCPGRPLEETFCRMLNPGNYSTLISQLHEALVSAEQTHLAALLRPHIQQRQEASTSERTDSSSADAVYPLPVTHPHGLCVIINVNSFIEANDPSTEVTLSPRRGSDIDTLRLEGTFRLFGFEILQLRDPDDLTITTLFANLRNDARLSCMSCLAVCIMTHGDDQDNLYFHDRTSRSLSNLRRLCYTPLLLNKPRLFFVQACRGGQILQPIFLEQDGIQAFNRESDCLISSATVSGYPAMRSQSAGSWYISDLCEALQRIGHTSPMRSVLQLGRRLLNSRVDRMGNHYVMQVSEDITTLQREVQLVRGTEQHFSRGIVLLMILEIMELLIDEAVDRYCEDLQPDTVEMTGILQRLEQEELYYGY